MTTKLSKTAQVLREMGLGPRVGVDPRSAARIFVCLDSNTIQVEFSAYAWLIDRLEYDAGMDRRYQSWRSRKIKQGSECGRMVDFPIYLRVKGEYTTVPGKDERAAFVLMDVNPGEVSLLDRRFYLVCFELRRTVYVILRADEAINRPRAFRVIGPKWEQILAFGEGVVRSEKDDLAMTWVTLDGRHWNVGTYCVPNSHEVERLDEYLISRNEKDRGHGMIYVDPEGNCYCPILGVPLQASWE